MLEYGRARRPQAERQRRIEAGPQIERQLGRRGPPGLTEAVEQSPPGGLDRAHPAARDRVLERVAVALDVVTRRPRERRLLGPHQPNEARDAEAEHEPADVR